MSDGYGYAPPQYQAHAYPPSPRSGYAVTALVLGIVAILGAWMPIFNIFSALIGVVGIVFGVMSLRAISRDPVSNGGKGMAIAGIVTSALTIGAAFLLTLFIVLAAALDDGTPGSIEDGTSSSYYQEPA